MVNTVNLPAHLVPQAFMNQQEDHNHNDYSNQPNLEQQQEQTQHYHSSNSSPQKRQEVHPTSFQQQQLQSQQLQSHANNSPHKPSQYPLRTPDYPQHQQYPKQHAQHSQPVPGAHYQSPQKYPPQQQYQQSQQPGAYGAMHQIQGPPSPYYASGSSTSHPTPQQNPNYPSLEPTRRNQSWTSQTGSISTLDPYGNGRPANFSLAENDQPGSQQSQPYYTNQGIPDQNYNQNFNQRPTNGSFDAYNQPQYDENAGQAAQYAKPSNRSASSLTYEANSQFQGSGKGSTNIPYPVDNQVPGHPSLHPTIHEQSEQYTPAPKARKAPTTNLPPIQTDQMYNNFDNRRIVSSPHHQQAPRHVNQDARTKSLSSSSSRFKSAQQLQHNQMHNNHDQSNNTRPLSGERGGSSTSLHHTFSLSSKSRSFSSISKFSSSLSTKKFNSSSSLGKADRTSNASSKTMVPMHPSSNAVVYPAILSEVAKVFKEAIILTINTKDGLEYHDTFTGKMAVDILCRVIKTNDRNLALLLGRTLDAQKFFHDVTYNHRLRDSVHEVYAFSHIYNDVDFYNEDGSISNGNNSNAPSKQGSFSDSLQLQQAIQENFLAQQLPQHVNQPSSAEYINSGPLASNRLSGGNNASVAGKKLTATQQTGVNGVFTILTDCYSPTCSRNHLCYSIACPRRLEQQARLNMKPQGGLKRAVSRLSLHDQEENETLWHKTVPQSVLDRLDKHEKTRQELIYEFIYTERDYVKDLEFMTDFYIMPLRNPANNIIPEHQREIFIQTVFGGVGDLLRLGKGFSEALTKRQQQQKPVIETIGDVFLDHVGNFEPFIRYSGNKVFATFEHERQQQVNIKYARFLDAIEKKPESRRQDLSSFLIKGVQRPARYQLLLAGILKHTKPESPDYKYLVKAKEEIEALLVKINVQTGESTDRHKIMVLHRLLGKQTLENKFNFKLSYNNRILYQVTLNRKRDNEKIDLYLFEHALLLVKHKIQNKREQHKVFEKPILLPLLFVNSGFEAPTNRTLMNFRYNVSLVSDTSLKNQRTESSNYIGNTLSSNNANKFQLNFLGLGRNQVHVPLFAEDSTIQSQVLQQIAQQQRKLIDANDLFSMSKYETRRFTGNNKINCAVPCYGGKKLLYGTDSGVWVSTVRSISTTSNEKICSDPTLVISKPYVTQVEVLVEYSKLLVLSDKALYEFDLACTDSLDHMKNTKSGKLIMTHISFFKYGVCDGKLLIIGAKTGSQHSICIFEPINPFDPKQKNRNKNKIEIQEIPFTSDPISISFMKSKLCIGCTKGFEILSLQSGNKEPILDEADPSLDFATQRESVTPLVIHRLGKDVLLCYSEFVFLINKNGWRTNHDWGIFWEGTPQNVALFFPYLLSFEPGFIEIRDLHTTNLIRALVGENIRFLHSNEHEAMFACEERGYDIIISIDFLNLKPKSPTIK
ncbi:ROM2 [Candida margitis]|uniref:ROM2 n=1 Tax=Candida margitis TaxID=1775924 RepID=UPI002227A36F|nr:ROM2 [Candida margitis]KAI5954012.1 ROM2 [Candida margitis]